jgi:hypothetical protein
MDKRAANNLNDSSRSEERFADAEKQRQRLRGGYYGTAESLRKIKCLA